MAEIDNLQIKISADANKATNALNKLANSLGNFQKSVTWDVGKLYSIGTGIKNIADAATGFKGAKSKELTSLATALKNFDKVDTVSLRGVGSAISELSKGMSGVQSIDVSSVVSVASAVAKLGGKNATAGAKNLVTLKDDLSQFVRGMNSVGNITFDTTNLSNLITSINKLGYGTVTSATKNLPILSAQMQNFVREMNKIGSFNFDMTNLSTMVTAIGRLGSVASGRAVSNIPLLADNLKYMFEVLSKAPAVSNNVIRMTQALANLARTGASSGSAARSLGNSLNMFSKSASTAKSKSFSLASAIGKLYATYWVFFRGFGKIKDAIDISSDLTEVENVVRQTFGNYESMMQDFVKTSITQYGMSELTAKQVGSRFQAMGTAIGFSQGKMADMSIELTKLTGDLASFYNEEQSDVARRLQSIFTGETEPMRRYGVDLTNATLKEYAMSKGLNSNISAMTQAEKTMLRYQYVIERTSNAQGDFARTSDTWANQIRQLKQQFEAWSAIVGSSLINAFKPFVKTLNAVMQKVIQFTTVVTNALGSIFGWKYEVSAGGLVDDWSDSMSDFSDATGSAANNAKKLKNNLLGIDELNVISKDNTSGSGSGTGGTGAAGVGAGELVQVDTIFKDYESNIKDLYTLGKTISDTLSSAMEGINWDSIYEKARGFGTGLAQFLNGLISPRLFGNVGKTIAGALNTAISAALSFGQEFDFKNLGESLAQGVNDFFDTFDFEELGKTIDTWVQGLKDAIKAFFDKVEWKDVLKGLTDTLSELSVDTVTIIIGSFVIKAVAGKTIGGLFKAAVLSALGLGASGAGTVSLGTIVFSVVPNILMSMNPGMIGQLGIWIDQYIISGSFLDTSTWNPDGIMKKIDNFLWDVCDAIIDSISYIFSTAFNFDTTLELFDIAGTSFTSIKDDFEKKDWGAIGVDIIKGIASGIAGVISTVLEPIADLIIALLNPFTSYHTQEDFENKFEELKHNDLIKMNEQRKNAGYSYKTFDERGGGSRRTEKGSLLDPFGPDYKETTERIYNSAALISLTKDDFNKGNWGSLGNDITLGILEGILALPTYVDEGINKLFDSIWKSICDVFGIHSPAEEMKPLGEFILGGVIEGFNSKISDFTLSIQTWFDESVKPWFTVDKWKELGTNAKTGLSTKWSEFKLWWKTTGFGKWWDDVKSHFTTEKWTWSGIKSGLSTAWNNAIAAVKQIWNKFADWMNEKLNFSWDPVTIAGIQLAPGGSINLGKIPTFETGGYVPSRYTMFMAGENGVPEIAGTVGGKTAVAGGVEITGIKDAINTTAEAQMRMMQQEIDLLKQLLAKETSVNIGDRDIARANLRGQKAMGLQIIT